MELFIQIRNALKLLRKVVDCPPASVATGEVE